MRTEYYQGRLFINKEKTSPYWCVTFEGRDGKMKRRSTKVPVKGGMFEGMQITAKLAEKLAYQRGVQIALAEEKEYNRHDNTTVRNWCEAYIRGQAQSVWNALLCFFFGSSAKWGQAQSVGSSAKFAKMPGISASEPTPTHSPHTDSFTVFWVRELMSLCVL